jgi:hypothetical protein
MRMRRRNPYHEIFEPAVSTQGDQFWLNSQLYARPAFFRTEAFVVVARFETVGAALVVLVAGFVVLVATLVVLEDVAGLTLEAVVFRVVEAVRLTVTVLVNVVVIFFVVVVGTHDVAR